MAFFDGLPEGAPVEEKPVVVSGARPYDFSGMFGIRGTPRDILGVLGDAFLVQGGRNPVYQQRQQLEREANAMRGFADDPLAAVSRMTRVNPDMARDLYNDQTTRERYDAQIRRQNNMEDRLNQVAQARLYDQLQTRLTGLMMSASDQDSYTRARTIGDRLARRYGFDFSEFGYPESFEEASDMISLGQGLSMSPKEQLAAEDRDLSRNVREQQIRGMEDYRNRNLEERRTYHQQSMQDRRDRTNIYRSRGAGRAGSGVGGGNATPNNGQIRPVMNNGRITYQVYRNGQWVNQ